MALAPGDRLHVYEILGPLGAGGMGEVYRARDVVLKRDVAIKVLPAFVSQDPDRLRRFEQEAQAAAALNHPNILAVFQFGTFDGAPYLVSELLDGITLRELIERGPIPTRKTIEYGIQIVHGLAAAHERNIVHRDLKPENLFVVKDGRIKILDFGLAKLIQPPSYGNGDAPTRAAETEPGKVLGTVGYMSPEQVRGNTVDHRADIFAFGTILYEMVSGKRAFQRGTQAESMVAILNEEPAALSQSGKNIPPGLQRVIHRCLEKSPDRRFQSAADLAFALESLSDTSGASELARAPDSRKFGRGKWIAVSGALLALLVGALLLLYFHGAGSRRESALLEVIALTESGKVRRVAATPDGRYIAYVQKDAGKFDMRLLQVATRRDVQLLPPSPLEIVNLHFSPDGNFIYFLRSLSSTDSKTLGVYRIAALGGPATTLASDARMYGITVSPDGKQIAYLSETPTESDAVAVDPDGSNRHVLARRPYGQKFWLLEWSPSLNSLAAVAAKDQQMGFVRIDLPSGSIQELNMSGWGALGQPAWSLDGATVFVPAVRSNATNFQIWAFDARSGADRRVTSDAGDYGQFTLSSTASGDLIAITEKPATTLWADDRLTHMRKIPSLPSEGFDGLIWVDGRIVTSNMVEMHVHDSDGANPVRIKSYSDIYRNLARCNEGGVAYWAVDDTYHSHIARTDIQSGNTVRLTDGPSDINPACSADGSTLVFEHCTKNGERCSVMRKSLSSGQTASLYEQAYDDDSGNPVLSPDGSKVLIDILNAKDPHSWLLAIPLSGGPPQPLKMPVTRGEVNEFRWAPDGKSILYSRDENGVGNIWSAPLDGKPPRKLTSFDSEGIFAFDVSPDNRLALSRGSFVRDAVLIKNAK